MIYYISDLHFGHRNIIKMDGRPFETIEQMDEQLILSWSERVTDDDDVYIVGDFAYRNGNTAIWYLRQLKGRKHLVIGNHDYITIGDEKTLAYFASVEKMNLIVDKDRTVSLCHFPIAEWNGKRRGGYHIYGHIHNRNDEVYEFMSRFDRALNAGCMVNGYRPVTLDELIENNSRLRKLRLAEVITDLKFDATTV